MSHMDTLCDFDMFAAESIALNSHYKYNDAKSIEIGLLVLKLCRCKVANTNSNTKNVILRNQQIKLSIIHIYSPYVASFKHFCVCKKCIFLM